MDMVPVNYLAVLVSAATMMVLGFLWYGPIFGKQWSALMDFTPEKMAAAKAKGMTVNYVIMIISALLMSFVLAHALIFASTYLKIMGFPAGLMAGFWNWLGFVVPVSVGSVLWDGKPWKLWFINAGYYLVGLLLMGIILAMWV